MIHISRYHLLRPYIDICTGTIRPFYSRVAYMVSSRTSGNQWLLTIELLVTCPIHHTSPHDTLINRIASLFAFFIHLIMAVCVFVNICKHTHMYTYIHLYIHICIHTHIYIYTYIYTYTYLYANV